MNWSKSKTIFILLFILIDLSLMGYLAFDRITDRLIPRSAVEQVCLYLENHQVHLDAKLLPRWTPKVRNLEFTNILDKDLPFLKQFETDIEELGQIEGELKLEKGERSIIIQENNFDYRDLLNPNEYSVASANTLKYLKSYLTSLGFDVRQAEVQLTDEGEGLVTYRFTQAAEGLSVDDITVDVSLSASGEVRAQGIWLNPVDAPNEYKKALVRPITGTLVEFSRKIDREATITDIAIKYRVDETKSYHKTFTAVAVWRIGISDGTYYYHNARQ